jgi:hypothetical protein
VIEPPLIQSEQLYKYYKWWEIDVPISRAGRGYCIDKCNLARKLRFYLKFNPVSRNTPVYPICTYEDVRNLSVCSKALSRGRSPLGKSRLFNSSFFCGFSDVPLNLGEWRMVVKNELIFLRSWGVINLTKNAIESINKSLFIGIHAKFCGDRWYLYGEIPPPCSTIMKRFQVDTPTSFIDKLKRFFKFHKLKRFFKFPNNTLLPVKMLIIIMGIFLVFYLIFYFLSKILRFRP